MWMAVMSLSCERCGSAVEVCHFSTLKYSFISPWPFYSVSQPDEYVPLTFHLFRKLKHVTCTRSDYSIFFWNVLSAKQARSNPDITSSRCTVLRFNIWLLLSGVWQSPKNIVAHIAAWLYREMELKIDKKTLMVQHQSFQIVGCFMKRTTSQRWFMHAEIEQLWILYAHVYLNWETMVNWLVWLGTSREPTRFGNIDERSPQEDPPRVCFFTNRILVGRVPIHMSYWELW